MCERDNVNKKIAGEIILLVIIGHTLRQFVELLQFAENVPISCPGSLNMTSVI